MQDAAKRAGELGRAREREREERGKREGGERKGGQEEGGGGREGRGERITGLENTLESYCVLH